MGSSNSALPGDFMPIPESITHQIPIPTSPKDHKGTIPDREPNQGLYINKFSVFPNPNCPIKPLPHYAGVTPITTRHQEQFLGSPSKDAKCVGCGKECTGKVIWDCTRPLMR